MKKTLLLFLFVASMFSLRAQNIQLHYNLGKERQFLTSTVEMFRPDKYGTTFFFIDMDYSSDARNVHNGISMAYWEIARAFKWHETQKFMPRVEYDGGVLKLDGDLPWVPIEDCFLTGIERAWSTADFSKFVSLQANYKYIKDKENVSFQITAVWSLQFFENKLSLDGFADFWKEGMDWYGPDGAIMNTTNYRFYAEPQFWYNINQHFALGNETKVGVNFDGDDVSIYPTVAVKVTF